MLFWPIPKDFCIGLSYFLDDIPAIKAKHIEAIALSHIEPLGMRVLTAIVAMNILRVRAIILPSMIR